jgi:AbrB family looped-hinge helix DNA binding protein
METIKEKVKVTRNFRVTIPSKIRNKIGLKEGDLVEVVLNGEEIIIRKSPERPRIKLGRKLTLRDIELVIKRGMRVGEEGEKKEVQETAKGSPRGLRHHS